MFYRTTQQEKNSFKRKEQQNAHPTFSRILLFSAWIHTTSSSFVKPDEYQRDDFIKKHHSLEWSVILTCSCTWSLLTSWLGIWSLKESQLTKWQTCSVWSLRPPPPPARKATSCRSGTPLHTCASRSRGRGRSSPCSPRPGSHTCPCCWRAVGLCCHTLCSWPRWFVCVQEDERLTLLSELFTLMQQLHWVFSKRFSPSVVFFNYRFNFIYIWHYKTLSV